MSVNIGKEMREAGGTEYLNACVTLSEGERKEVWANVA